MCGPVEMSELPTSGILSDGEVPTLDEVHVDVDGIPDVSVSMTSVSLGIGGGPSGRHNLKQHQKYL